MRFRTMLLKIQVQFSCSSHSAVFAECFPLRKVLLGQSYVSEKSVKSPALMTVAPIEKTSDLTLFLLSSSLSLADKRSSGASITFFDGESASIALPQFVLQYGKDERMPILMFSQRLINTFQGLISPTTSPLCFASILTATKAQRRQYSCFYLKRSFLACLLLIQSERRQGYSGQLTQIKTSVPIRIRVQSTSSCSEYTPYREAKRKISCLESLQLFQLQISILYSPFPKWHMNIEDNSFYFFPQQPNPSQKRDDCFQVLLCRNQHFALEHLPSVSYQMILLYNLFRRNQGQRDRNHHKKLVDITSKSIQVRV